MGLRYVCECVVYVCPLCVLECAHPVCFPDIHIYVYISKLMDHVRPDKVVIVKSLRKKDMRWRYILVHT